MDLDELSRIEFRWMLRDFMRTYSIQVDKKSDSLVLRDFIRTYSIGSKIEDEKKFHVDNNSDSSVLIGGNNEKTQNFHNSYVFNSEKEASRKELAPVFLNEVMEPNDALNQRGNLKEDSIRELQSRMFRIEELQLKIQELMRETINRFTKTTSVDEERSATLVDYKLKMMTSLNSDSPIFTKTNDNSDSLDQNLLRLEKKRSESLLLGEEDDNQTPVSQDSYVSNLKKQVSIIKIGTSRDAFSPPPSLQQEESKGLRAENTNVLEEEINSNLRKELKDKFIQINGSKSTIELVNLKQSTKVSNYNIQFEYMNNQVNISHNSLLYPYNGYVSNKMLHQLARQKKYFISLYSKNEGFSCARHVFAKSPEPVFVLVLGPDMLFLYASRGLKPPKPPDYAINSRLWFNFRLAMANYIHSHTTTLLPSPKYLHSVPFISHNCNIWSDQNTRKKKWVLAKLIGVWSTRQNFKINNGHIQRELIGWVKNGLGKVVFWDVLSCFGIMHTRSKTILLHHKLVDFMLIVIVVSSLLCHFINSCVEVLKNQLDSKENVVIVVATLEITIAFCVWLNIEVRKDNCYGSK